jgi:hypothetical protein
MVDKIGEQLILQVNIRSSVKYVAVQKPHLEGQKIKTNQSTGGGGLTQYEKEKKQ